MRANFKRYVDQTTQLVITLLKYLENLNQDQSYRSVKNENRKIASRCRITSGVSARLHGSLRSRHFDAKLTQSNARRLYDVAMQDDKRTRRRSKHHKLVEINYFKEILSCFINLMNTLHFDAKSNTKLMYCSFRC